MIFTFDDCCLDVARRELWRCGRLIAVEPQVFDLLVYLLLHRDRVVGRDELVEVIWRRRCVSDSALTTRVNAVRRAVGDNGTEQRLIRTLRRKGIRFVGEVTTAAAPAPERKSERLLPNGTELAPAASAQGASIAVLPFIAIGGDREARWFAAGLVEDVVTALGRFSWLALHPPISSYGGRSLPDATQTGRRLGVRYVVQGAVRRSGRQIRVTAHLIDATACIGLWSEYFDGLLADGFALQDKFAAMIAGRIEPAVQSAERRRWRNSIGSAETPYSLHLQAQPIFSGGREPILAALGLLERALERDPDHGAALADAANCRQILDVNGWVAGRQQNRAKALSLARRTLLVSTDPGPVAIAAFVQAYFGEEVDAALAALDAALALNPSFAKAWYMRGMTRLYVGELEPAVDCFERAKELSPRDHIGRRSIAGIGFAHFFAGRFDEALAELRPVIQMFPRWATPYCVLASCHAHLGLLSEAKTIADRLLTMDTSPVPGAGQFHDRRHRELLLPGLALAGAAVPIGEWR